MKENSFVKANYPFFDRDMSWLSFNERVLLEARSESVPLMERIRFLAIYSSNLDEFYRVRMPTLLALRKLSDGGETAPTHKNLEEINRKISEQLQSFGETVSTLILPELRRNNIQLLYDEPLPDFLFQQFKIYFLQNVGGFVQVSNLLKDRKFFPENNKLYLAVTVDEIRDGKQVYIVNIPSDSLSRFYTLRHGETQYIVFLDDIVKLALPLLFPQGFVASHSFKITRDAELDLEDEFKGNLARKIEKKIHKRDLGLATRFLYEPGFRSDTLNLIKTQLNLKNACVVQGGRYHNLKDLSSLPIDNPALNYTSWARIDSKINHDSIFDAIKSADRLLHPPYHSYDAVMHFFNQAAIDPAVKSIYVTLYRVAKESRIVNALITAAKNGKRVTVFVELKARFDEANNIKWSKKMRTAGVKIIESIPGLKVHAKLALVKRVTGGRTELFGLLSTGNFNEITARYYADHILLTSNKEMLREVEYLFKVLHNRKARIDHVPNLFNQLLVGQFNLQQQFIELIDREIVHAKKGFPASIGIKFNNIEDKVLISKLYEASNAGVEITLIVRGICCLVPGVEGTSKNIKVSRIVDRYLEHGRVFIFHNNNNPDVYLGSADWMIRNIYRRIEVCFPIYDVRLKTELINIFNIQSADNVKAVTLDERCRNIPVDSNKENLIQSQKDISNYLQDRVVREFVGYSE
jgi:polyphosphate kinase